MKTTFAKTLMVLSLLTGLAFTDLQAASVANTVAPRPERTIASKFKFPTLLIPYNQNQPRTPVKIEVIFTTDKEGKVTYAFAKTNDLRLKQEIEKQFSTLRLSNLKENVAHSVVLNFKYLEG